MALSRAARTHLTQAAGRLAPWPAERLRLACASQSSNHTAENSMSKGMDSKKSEKKKPAKTMKEKKAAKQEKKKNK
jgi:hypothetical protein